jgi:hypothetical protein
MLGIVEMPVVQRDPVDSERVRRALVRPGDEPVERDRHVTRDEGQLS